MGADASDIVGDRKVSKPVNNKPKYQLPVSKDTSRIQNNIGKNLTVLAPKNECTQLVKQNDQTNDTISD